MSLDLGGFSSFATIIGETAIWQAKLSFNLGTARHV